MSGNRIGAIIAVAVLVILSVLIGNQVSGNLQENFAAFGIIAGIIGVLSLTIAGRQIWMLVLPVASACTHFHIHVLRGMPAEGLFSVFLLLLVWPLQYCLGHVRFKWHSLPIFDIIIFIVLAYVAVSFYRFPAYINLLTLGIDLDVQYIGGNIYLCAILALCCYVFFSFLDVKRAELEKVLYWCFWCGMAAELLFIVKGLATGNLSNGMGETDAGVDELGTTRVEIFYSFGIYLITWLLAKYSVSSIAMSPWRLGLLGITLAAGGASGHRSFIVLASLNAIFMSILRRSVVALVIVGGLAWGGLVVFSQTDSFHGMPLTMQRMLAVCPGVKVAKSMESQTENSSEVRVLAWKMALNPRTGYIKDYVWGDGFQEARSHFMRRQIAFARKTEVLAIGLNTDYLARNGMWHNGFITTMHRLGLVGCAIFYMAFIAGLVLVFRVAFALPDNKYRPYVWIYIAFAFTFPITYSYNARDPFNFFNDWLVPAAILKLFAVLLKEEGLLQPLFSHRIYVPLMLKELGRDNGTAT